MGAKTYIAWCDHTFNPWWGCTKVSPGCANCYAEAFDRRLGGINWSGSHKFFGDAHWREPLKWNEAARKAGVRRRVFCASMADVFEDAPGLAAERARLWCLIGATPSIDWLLLTKRPETCSRAAGAFPRNVWLGVSVEDQERADERIPTLLEIPARVRFLSVEPLLGPVDVRSVPLAPGAFAMRDPLRREGIRPASAATAIDWVIVGGESGPRARPCDVAWIRSIVAQCRAAGVPLFVKQLGSKPVENVPANPVHVLNQLMLDIGFKPDSRAIRSLATACAMIDLRDPKGADPSEWPEDLRVQEFPMTIA